METKIVEFLKNRITGVAPTWIIAHQLGVKTPTARKLLMKMEKKGLVIRNQDWSVSNSIYWRLV